MNLILITLLFQSLLLVPPRPAMENPAVVSEVPKKLKNDYDKLWARFIAGKDDAKLIKDIDKFLKKQKDVAAAIMIAAYVDLYQNNEASAAQKFQHVLSLSLDNRIALSYLAEFAFSARDYGKASDLYARLLAIDKTSSDVETKYRKARLLATDDLLRSADRAEQENRLSDAEALYRQILNISPREPAFHARLAGLLAKDKKWDEALAQYRQQLELTGRSVEVEKNIAEALMNLGRTDEARGLLDRLRKEGGVDENLEAKVNELEDLGRWGQDIDFLKEIRAADSITREQLSALMVRYFPQVTEFRQNPQIVTDIQASRARAEIQTIVGIGLIDPLPNHTFEPSTPITRSQFAASLVRLIRLLRVSVPNGPPIPVLDVDSGNARYTEIQLALGYGLMTLDDAGNFNVNGYMSGKDAVRAMERLLALSRKKDA